MRLDCVARLSLVRCRIPQLIPSHRMARHARTLQQAAILSSATSSSSSSSNVQMAEQISIEESIIAHRRLAMGDLDSATASSSPPTIAFQPSPPAAVEQTPRSRSLSVVVPAAAADSLRSPSEPSWTSSNQNQSTVVLPSAYLLSSASSAAAPLHEPVSLSRASSPSPSILSDCPDSNLPSDEPQLHPVDRCPSSALSSFYIPPSFSRDQSCPGLSLTLGTELPASAADVDASSPSSFDSRPPSVRSQHLAQRMSVYDDKQGQLSVLTFSSPPTPSSSSSPSSTPPLHSSHPSLVVPKPRRLLHYHPYASAATRQQHQQYQQAELQLMQQQQQQVLAQQYLAALQQSSLPRYLPAATPVLSLVSPSAAFPATFHYSFPSAPSSFSHYLISTLPDTHPVGAVLRV